MRKEISAKFTSRCSACGSTITPGETITYDPAVKYSSRHKVCPAVQQDSKPKIAKGTLLNSPVIAQPQVARLSDERASEILAEIGSTFVHPLPATEPALGIGYKITINGVEREIGTCNRWVGAVTDHKAGETWMVSLIDGSILEHLPPPDGWKYRPIDKWTRELGAPLSMEAHGKNSVQVGEVTRHQDHWYIITAVEKPYYMSAEDAEDMDMFSRGGGWATPYQMREIVEPAKEREKRESKEHAEKDTADKIIQATCAARAKACEFLPLGIRPLTDNESKQMREAIQTKQQADLVAENHRAQKLSEPVAKRVREALGDNWDRLPAMPGNEKGWMGWENIYRIGNRYVVDHCDRSYDGAGWYLQGISIAPEDAALLADQACRAAITAYQFDPRLYEIMVALDAEGKLSKYGKGSYFGGTPRPTHGPATKGAYSHHRNDTATEIRAELIDRLNSLDDDRARAACIILADENSVQEIR